MRKIILISFILFNNLVFSQSLFYYWYINKVVINEITYDAPINEENIYIILSIFDDKISTHFFNDHCGNLSSYDMYFDQNTIDLGEITYYNDDCNIKENNIFRDLHFSIYINDSDKVYDYSLSINPNGYEELTITNEFGDKAYYTDRRLDIADNKLELVSTFPNPTTNTLFIISENLQIKQLSVFNISGQKVIKIKEATSEIDVSTLQSGIYFLEITSEEGTAIKKFVKK